MSRGPVLVWTGAAEAPPRGPVGNHRLGGKNKPPLAYTPPYLAEKILTAKSVLEGERKQVTVLFADLRGSLELLAEFAYLKKRPGSCLIRCWKRMIAAVHRYEGTVNQIMGDGIMALFGAPIAHEDHAAPGVLCGLGDARSPQGPTPTRFVSHTRSEIQIRVGLNSGEVVVRAIGNDLHMDYSAIGQTTHLAARMEQSAMPGSILLTAETLRLAAEALVQTKPLGP